VKEDRIESEDQAPRLTSDTGKEEDNERH